MLGMFIIGVSISEIRSSKIISELKKKCEEADEKCEYERNTKEYFKKCYEEMADIEEQKYLAEEKCQELQQQLIDKSDYVEALKSIYTCSSSELTRVYAIECLKHPKDLDLFNPITYTKNPRYAQIIDQNAEKLTRILTSYWNDGIYDDRPQKTREQLNALLKGNGTGCGGGSNPPIPTRSRQALQKIDKGVQGYPLP